jgi:hypothetical protein
VAQSPEASVVPSCRRKSSLKRQAQLVVAEVDGDAVDPSREVDAIVDAIECFQDVVEGLLDEVLGQLAVADVTRAERTDALVVA